MDDKVEVAFSTGGRTLYLDLPRTEIPRISETVCFAGDSVKGSEWEGCEFTVTGVCRTYDKDDSELTFVNVSLDTGGV